MVTSSPHGTARATTAILVAGLIAGALDIAQALLLFGSRVLLSIAGGLLGTAARSGGAPIYALGLVLHCSIATIFAAIYYLAAWRLRFLLEHPVVCGLVYGVLVELSMALIVLPLSALHAKGPFQLNQLLLGIGVHMVAVGLPISLTMRSLLRR
jgi:hypothetical protein